MKNAAVIIAALCACATEPTDNPKLDSVQQIETGIELCGPFPRLDAELHINLRANGTVDMPRQSWDAIVAHLTDTERWGFCMAFPPT
jgi:hypothetical protein